MNITSFSNDFNNKSFPSEANKHSSIDGGTVQDQYSSQYNQQKHNAMPINADQDNGWPNLFSNDAYNQIIN